MKERWLGKAISVEGRNEGRRAKQGRTGAVTKQGREEGIEEGGYEPIQCRRSKKV